jgi:anhydro-N-acetylmuramic acid kinase
MPCDRGGKIAASGRVDRALLDDLLADPYYRRPPPKSAGREQYGAAFVARLKNSGLPMRDLIATATVLTAATVAQALLPAVSALVPTRCAPAKRREARNGSANRKSRRGTQECVRHSPTDLIVSGGGVHNPQIMAHLAGFLPGIAISTSTDHGVDADAKEAIAFAVLAYQTWRRRPSNLPSATGARHAVVLGDITF